MKRLLIASIFFALSFCANAQLITQTLEQKTTPDPGYARVLRFKKEIGREYGIRKHTVFTLAFTGSGSSSARYAVPLTVKFENLGFSGGVWVGNPHVYTDLLIDVPGLNVALDYDNDYYYICVRHTIAYGVVYVYNSLDPENGYYDGMIEPHTYTLSPNAVQITGSAERVANKAGTVDNSTTSYPNNSAVKTYVDGKFSFASSKVVSTTTGNGSNIDTWTKIASVNLGSVANSDFALTLLFVAYSGSPQSATVTFSGRQSSAGNAPTVIKAEVLNMSTGTTFTAGGFKIVNSGFASNFDVYVKKSHAFGSIGVWELGKAVPGGATLSYFSSQSWVSEPTATYFGLSSLINNNNIPVTASGNGSATTISIPHGQAFTPVAPIVQASNAAAGGISYVTADATNINIVYAAAPASGTNNLSYSVSYRKP